MPVRQRMSMAEDGRSVVVKHATAGADAERLAHEAAILRAAAHPGVVELVAERVLDGGDHEVMLAMAGSRTAADVRVGLDAAAGLVASLAATVADLHDLGIAHGRIRPEHVIIDGTGRPILCGFGHATRTEPGELRAHARAADVAGLGELLRRLVTAGADGAPAGRDVGWEPIPARRFGRRDRWTGQARRALLNLADHATAEEPAHRPSARGLAAAVLAALPEARLPGAAEPASEADLPPPAPARPLRWLPQWWAQRRAGSHRLRSLRLPAMAPVAAAVGLGLLVFGVGGLLRSPSPAAPRPAASLPTVSLPGGVDSAAAPSSTAVPAPLPAPEPLPAGPAPGCQPVRPPAADPDGDGCDSPVTLGDGWVAVGGVRYQVGEAGDLLAVGDWDCDGSATVAVVRRPGGEVFVFPAWPTESGPLDAGRVATVADPVRVSVDAGSGGPCEALVIEDGDGRRVVVRP